MINKFLQRYKVSLSPQKIALAGAFFAIFIILNSLTINLVLFSLNFGFIAGILMTTVIGPYYGMFLFMISDIIMDLIHGWPINPLFTVAVAVGAIIYGIYFYQRELSISRWQDWLGVIITMTLQITIVNFFLFSLADSLQLHVPLKAVLLRNLSLFSGIIIMSIIIMLVLPTLQRIPRLNAIMFSN